MSSCVESTKRFISYAEIDNLTLKIASKIESDNWKPDYVVGIARGGLLPAIRLSNFFNVPMECLKINLRDHTENGLESNLWLPNEAMVGKNILIVDDINDTGNTINWLMEDWGQTANMPWHKEIRVAVLFDNAQSKANMIVDYAGEVIDKGANPTWLVFPWEFE